MKEMTFWEHLDDLRAILFRVAAAVVLAMVVVFPFKEIVFGEILLAPTSSDFFLYQWLCRIGESFSLAGLCPETFTVKMINIDLSGQFFIHLRMSFWIGLTLVFPFIIYQLWTFVSPALREKERRAALPVFASGSLLFYLGVTMSYFLLFPLTLRFLGTYQVSELVENQISLDSYISTLTLLCLAMGLLFEMPVLVYFLSKVGLLKRAFLKKYRKHAIVIILIISAIITPTADPFTMLIMGLPLILLYQVSIYICSDSGKLKIES
jgi:sec-independent protein translocase protein TatC